MPGLLETTVMGLLTGIAFLYDCISYIPYYIICRPDLKVQQSKRKKAASISGKPDGPYRCVEVGGNKKLTTSLFEDCRTLDDLFIRAVQTYGSAKCLGTRDLLSEEDEMQPNGRVFKKLIMGDYRWQTFEEILTRATNFGSGLLALGQKPRKNTLIFSETKAEWMIAAQACFKYNFPVVTLYATLGSDAIVHGIKEAEVSYVITSTSLLSKFKDIIDKIPKVTHIIYIGQEKAKIPDQLKHLKILSMEEVENIGAEPDNIKTPVTKPRPEDIAVIMYTSGSTGIPKGVLISHANLMAGMSGQCEKIQGLGPNDTYVGYLPLAHVLELSAEISCISHGTRIGYSSPLTLTDNSSKIKRGSLGDVSVLKPTLMASVPAIMDRLYKGVWEKVNKGSSLSKAMFEFACDYKQKRLLNGMDTPIINRIIFSKVRDILGGHVRMMLSGGAPLSAKTQRFMNVCFCCPVLQGYGLTETCGAGTIAEVTDLSTGRVGAPLTCSELRLRDWPDGNYLDSDKPNPRGEILVGGGNIVMGYYLMEEKTKEDFTEINGVRYFCTGDIGEIEEDGCLKVIDRKKDLVKLQAGEYVAVGQVETVLTMHQLVDQIFIYADSNHEYTIAFVVPNEQALEKLAKELSVEGSHEDLCRNNDLTKEALKQITEYGIKSNLERYCLPRQLKLCPEPWMPDSGLVTNTMKLKRKSCEMHYEKDIKNMYSK